MHWGAEWLPKSPGPRRGLGDLVTCGITERRRGRAAISLSAIEVGLGGCDNLTDAAVVVLAEHFLGLISVDLAFFDNLTDAEVVALAEHCPGLTYEDLGDIQLRITGGEFRQATELKHSEG